jgi:hypothetical protein
MLAACVRLSRQPRIVAGNPAYQRGRAASAGGDSRRQAFGPRKPELGVRPELESARGAGFAANS